MINSLIRSFLSSSNSATEKMNKASKNACYTFVPFKIECVTPDIVRGSMRLKPEQAKGVLIPLPRSGHRVICIGTNLYVFGGFNQFIRPNDYLDDDWFESCPLFKELWKFDTLSKRWTRLRNTSGMPDELASHSAVACSPYMIVYGGTATPFGEASSNSVHLCYLPKGEWTKLDTHGNFMPTPMYGQSVCREKDELFVVGGTTGYEYTLDVHRLNLKTLEWTYLSPNISISPLLPDSRYRHEIVFHKNCLYVFGGGTSDKAFRLDALPTFDLVEQAWAMTKTHPDPSTEDFPKPRKCHVLVKYKLNNSCTTNVQNWILAISRSRRTAPICLGHKLYMGPSSKGGGGCVTSHPNTAEPITELRYHVDVYIEGGTNETEHLNDFWRLDLRTLTWRKLAGTTEKPIYFHSGAVTEEGAIYMFGGIWETESTRTNQIFKVHVDVPSLLTMAWQAVDFYAPNLSEMPHSRLLELGIPRFIVESLKSVSEVG